MIFDFKTTSVHGILFHMSRAGRRHDFVALDIIDGHPRYHIRCRHAEATLTLSQVKVDDGQWHRVRIYLYNLYLIGQMSGKISKPAGNKKPCNYIYYCEHFVGCVPEKKQQREIVPRQ